MTTTVSAYAATSATEPLTKTTITRRDVGPHDVAIDIQFAGICHSDIHTVEASGVSANYPMVPGHEIAGIVTEVGSEVTKYKVGDRVGVGCFVDSCRECAAASPASSSTATTRDGRHLQRASAATASRRRVATAARSSSTRTTCCAFPTASRWTPPRRCCARASPLYSPLRHWNAGPGKRVAVIGLGGLGHMARQARGRDGRRGDGAQPVAEEDGGRPSPRRDRVLRHQRPRDVRQAGGHVRPDPQHRVGEPRLADYLGLLDARRHAGGTRHAGASDGGPGVRADPRSPQHLPVR